MNPRYFKLGEAIRCERTVNRNQALLPWHHNQTTEAEVADPNHPLNLNCCVTFWRKLGNGIPYKIIVVGIGNQNRIGVGIGNQNRIGIGIEIKIDSESEIKTESESEIKTESESEIKTKFGNQAKPNWKPNLNLNRKPKPNPNLTYPDPTNPIN